jgi:hypothetical protein
MQAGGMTSLCPEPSEWTGTAWQPMFIPDWLEPAVSSERFSREDEEHAELLPSGVLNGECTERFVLEAVTVFRHNDEWAIEERFVLRSVNFVAALPSNSLHLRTMR